MVIYLWEKRIKKNSLKEPSKQERTIKIFLSFENMLAKLADRKYKEQHRVL